MKVFLGGCGCVLLSLIWAMGFVVGDRQFDADGLSMALLFFIPGVLMIILARRNMIRRMRIRVLVEERQTPPGSTEVEDIASTLGLNEEFVREAISAEPNPEFESYEESVARRSLLTILASILAVCSVLALVFALIDSGGDDLQFPDKTPDIVFVENQENHWMEDLSIENPEVFGVATPSYISGRLITNSEGSVIHSSIPATVSSGLLLDKGNFRGAVLLQNIQTRFSWECDARKSDGFFATTSRLHCDNATATVVTITVDGTNQRRLPPRANGTFLINPGLHSVEIVCPENAGLARQFELSLPAEVDDREVIHYVINVAGRNSYEFVIVKYEDD